MTWSDSVNGFLYEFVALVLQASQAHDITIPGCAKYNVPSGKITIDDTVATYYPNKTSYTQEAIAGADDFNDGDTTIRDIFDIIVENTREVTPTGESLSSARVFILLTYPRSSGNCLVDWVGMRRNNPKEHVLKISSTGTFRMGGLSAPLSGFLRTVPRSSNTRSSSSGIPFVNFRHGPLSI